MADGIPNQLKEVADKVKGGHEQKVSVRTLLFWFYAERRGYWKLRAKGDIQQRRGCRGTCFGHDHNILWKM